MDHNVISLLDGVGVVFPNSAYMHLFSNKPSEEEEIRTYCNYSSSIHGISVIQYSLIVDTHLLFSRS